MGEVVIERGLQAGVPADLFDAPGDCSCRDMVASTEGGSGGSGETAHQVRSIGVLLGGVGSLPEQSVCGIEIAAPERELSTAGERSGG